MKSAFSNLLFLSILLAGCALPCPKDKKQGTIDFTENTKTWVNPLEKLNKLTFEDNNNEKLELNLRYSDTNTNNKILLEVLCERGDFLDKTVQVRYIESPQFNLTFANNNSDFEFYISASIINDKSELGQDTILYDNFISWAQDIKTSTSGAVSIVTSFRGSRTRFSQKVMDAEEEYMFADKIQLDGKLLENVYYNKQDKNGIQVFYSKEKGPLAIKVLNKVWHRTF